MRMLAAWHFPPVAGIIGVCSGERYGDYIIGKNRPIFIIGPWTVPKNSYAIAVCCMPYLPSGTRKGKAVLYQKIDGYSTAQLKAIGKEVDLSVGRNWTIFPFVEKPIPLAQDSEIYFGLYITTTGSNMSICFASSGTAKTLYCRIDVAYPMDPFGSADFSSSNYWLAGLQYGVRK